MAGRGTCLNCGRMGVEVVRVAAGTLKAQYVYKMNPVLKLPETPAPYEVGEFCRPCIDKAPPGHLEDVIHGERYDVEAVAMNEPEPDRLDRGVNITDTRLVTKCREYIDGKIRYGEFVKEVELHETELLHYRPDVDEFAAQLMAELEDPHAAELPAEPEDPDPHEAVDRIYRELLTRPLHHDHTHLLNKPVVTLTNTAPTVEKTGFIDRLLGRG